MKVCPHLDQTLRSLLSHARMCLRCRYGRGAMNTNIRRWGNSLAIRIPKAFAEETGLQPDDEVEITVQNGQIILTPVKHKRYSLDELLADMPSDSEHSEWDMGPDVGDEVW